MDYKHEVIMCVVNAGYTNVAMAAARKFGARGGTVINARGTANLEAEKRFNISVQPEKEIVLILVEREVRDDILHALYQEVGLQTAGQCIAFSLPVEEVIGLMSKDELKNLKQEDKQENNSQPVTNAKEEK